LAWKYLIGKKNQLLNEIRYEGEGKREQMRSAYLQLAFLRSCYDILTPTMRKWLLYTSNSSNKLFQCKRFYPISSTWDLICILQDWMLNVPDLKKTKVCLNELANRGKGFIWDALEGSSSISFVKDTWEKAGQLYVYRLQEGENYSPSRQENSNTQAIRGSMKWKG
jgi:hypothetical protein